MPKGEKFCKHCGAKWESEEGDPALRERLKKEEAANEDLRSLIKNLKAQVGNFCLMSASLTAENQSLKSQRGGIGQASPEELGVARGRIHELEQSLARTAKELGRYRETAASWQDKYQRFVSLLF